MPSNVERSLRRSIALPSDPHTERVQGGSVDGEKPVDLDTEDADVAMGECG